MTWTVDLWRMSRVLVVDDDPNLRHLVSVRLQKAGHRVLVADSAAEALAVVQDRGAPDVVVLDVTMPGMTGLELLPAMRSLDGCEALPAIFLSGRVDHADVAAGRALGRDLPHEAVQRRRAGQRDRAPRAGRSRLVGGEAPLRGVAGREVRPAAERAVVARPARAVRQRLLEPVERAEPPAEVVDHVHERRLARARDHR